MDKKEINIDELLQEKKLSISELAAKVKLHERSIYRFKNEGIKPKPPILKLLNLVDQGVI